MECKECRIQTHQHVNRCYTAYRDWSRPSDELCCTIPESSVVPCRRHSEEHVASLESRVHALENFLTTAAQFNALPKGVREYLFLLGTGMDAAADEAVEMNRELYAEYRECNPWESTAVLRRAS